MIIVPLWSMCSLHHRKDSWTEARHRADEHRGELAVADANGILPLHIAVWHKAPKDLVELFVRGYPESVSKKTNSGYYAIDYAKLFHSEDAAAGLAELLKPQELEEQNERQIVVDGSQTELHKLCFWKWKEASARVALAPEEISYQVRASLFSPERRLGCSLFCLAKPTATPHPSNF